ncbi:DegT/DnrJ/EryC1/StrS family aminotransferase [Polynucleobacter necessarius]|uniref:DegT/DnrJ/EryC1/StrS family aminotransferase n=1 Tax=Polynucleobacter necessarius TaxID=576610 RepID=UPI000E098123|nr:DegT/DnrJ/EryC1/StrS family aminotransferase [Polynucleobacter necessarius]
MKYYPVSEPSFIGNEKKYLQQCIDEGWISSEGPFVDQFEKKYSKAVNRKHGIAVSSGSAALDIAIKAIGIGAGDEVIMPAFTIISCASPIVRAGATPVLVDCDQSTYNMDVSQIERMITNKTKAILLVHIYGITANVDEVLALAKKHGLRLVEDAAEMHGQVYKSRPCGSFGDISITSFYANKLVTSGEGGMLMTDDDALANTARKLRNLYFDNAKRFIHDELGWNYRMTNLQAAVGLAQLEKMDEFAKIKRRIGEYYLKELEGVDGIQLPVYQNEYCKNIFWVFPLLLNKSYLGTAVEFAKLLQAKGVGTRPFFWPMHKQPVFLKMGFFKDEVHPISEYISEYGLYIPCSVSLLESDVIEISNRIKMVVSELKDKL